MIRLIYSDNWGEAIDYAKSHHVRSDKPWRVYCCPESWKAINSFQDLKDVTYQAIEEHKNGHDVVIYSTHDIPIDVVRMVIQDDEIKPEDVEYVWIQNYDPIDFIVMKFDKMANILGASQGFKRWHMRHRAEILYGRKRAKEIYDEEE